MNIIEIMRKANSILKNFIENTDLDINSWLIKWGYMNGFLQDGQIQPTKNTIIYQSLVIIILLLNMTRFTVFLFSTKNAQISKKLGEWSYFFGPRLIVNGTAILCAIYILFVMLFFKFCTQNLKKMFYWLNIMEYDTEN